MPFGREFSRYLPSIVQTLSEKLQRQKQQRLYQQLAAPFATDIPLPEDVAPEDFDTARISENVAAEQIRTPEYRRTAIEAGMTPGELLSLYKSLPREMRPDVDEMIVRAQRDYMQGQPLDPRMEAVVKAALGIKAEKSEPVHPYTEAEKRFWADPRNADRAMRIKMGFEPRVTAPKEPKVPKADITTGQALNELQGSVQNRIKALEGQRYEFITMAQWNKLSQDEKDNWFLDEQGQRYYRERPDVKAKIDEELKYLGDLGRQFKSADSLRAGRLTEPGAAIPTAGMDMAKIETPEPLSEEEELVNAVQTLPPEALTPEEMAQILRDVGQFEDADASDPDIEEDYRFWWEQRSDVNR